MNEKLKEYWQQMKKFTASMNKKTKNLIVIFLVMAVTISAVAALLLNQRPYTLLFGGLTQEETAEITAKLQDMGVPSKTENGGNILVPKQDEANLKATFLAEGYPKSGFTYDVFRNNVDLMTTDFEKQAYLLFDLQNRMESTIRLLDGVQDAKVTIALPEKNSYVMDDTAGKASASVVIIAKSGAQMTQEQATSIKRLVAGGIDGLSPDDVVLLDDGGYELAAGSGSGQGDLTKVKLELEKEIETHSRNKILALLEPIFGIGKVKISVKSTLDLAKSITESINYQPSVDNQGVISKGTAIIEGGSSAGEIGGIPGAESNADIPIYPSIDGTSQGAIGGSSQLNYDYLVSQVKEQVQKDAGGISDLTVAIVINGDTPMPAQQEGKLINLVANAAGIEEVDAAKKITVLTMPFVEEAAVNPASPEVGLGEIPFWYFLVAGGLALVLFVLLFVLLKGKKKKRKIEEDDFLVDDTTMQDEVMKEIKHMERTKGKELEKEQQMRKQTQDFSRSNPEIAAQLIRSWLKGGDAHGE